MQAIQAAAVARMEAVYQAAHVHKRNEIPDRPALPYGVVGLGPLRPRNYTVAGDHGTRHVRLLVQCFGATEDDCLFVAGKADDAFLGQVLTVAGWDCTKATGEISTPVRDPDGTSGVYALASYSFEATEADEESSSS